MKSVRPGFKMVKHRAVEIKTKIQASPETVYKNLMEFTSYPDWNPMITRIEGDAQVGSRLDLLFKMENRGREQRVRATVSKNVHNKEFRWVRTLFMSCLYRSEHYFLIDDHGKGRAADQCTFTHGETFSGLLLSIFKKRFGPHLESTFTSFNEAFKTRVEHDQKFLQ